jgi:hypothetical protein
MNTAPSLSRARIYDLIYALAARDGRHKTLFGNTAPLARAAFENGLCGTAFPELWFELPLAGEPWFDLHMLVAHGDRYEHASFAGLGGAYADALAWFANSEDTRQLALSFDTGRGVVDKPAIQLLMERRNVDNGLCQSRRLRRQERSPVLLSRLHQAALARRRAARRQGISRCRHDMSQGDRSLDSSSAHTITWTAFPFRL